MSKGGARPGAGRPRGSRSRATLDRDALISEAVVRARAAGVSNQPEMTPDEIARMSPLEVMLFAMVQEAVAGRWHLAAALAKECAPYRHARLSQVALNATLRPADQLSDDELATIAAGQAEAASE